MTSTQPTFIVLLALTLALASCGGGGDDAAPPPAVAAGTITIAAGGTVTSDDGKLQLIVAANSASAEGTATLKKATPSAAVLADPGYVPDSLYAYSGPDLEFSPPANWELASAQALTASAARKAALATSRNDIDVEKMCQAAYAQSRGQAPKNVWVGGDSCPATCTKQRAVKPGTRTARSFCLPVSTPSRAPLAQTCPAGTDDVSAEPAWATWATDNSTRVCQPPPARGAGLFGRSPATATTSCAIQNGSYVCRPPAVSDGEQNGTWGETSERPNSAGHGFYTFEEPAVTLDPSGNGYLVSMLPGGRYELKFRPRGNAENLESGLWGVTLFELIGFYAPPNGVFPQFEKRFIWQNPSNDPNNGWQGLCCNTPAYVAPPFVTVPWAADSGPAVRYFQVEAFGLVGEVRRSSVLRVTRASATAPTIASFSANPNALPIGGGGGATTLVWNVNGATSVSILPSIGNVANPSSGSALAVVTATTVFTLTATNSFGQTSTSNVIVTVAQDTTPPVVTLASSAASVIVPANVTLTATASDAIGVAKVEFLRGATVIATDFTAPYEHTVALGAADVGTITYRARAYDAAGNVSPTSGVVVAVTDPPGNGDTYASPSGVDAGNTTCAQTTPCLTIAKAASLAQPNKTVWLLNGDYTGLTQPVPIAIPSGLTLRAINPGLARIGLGIVLQGSGNVVGIVLRRFNFGDIGWIEASSGTVTIDGVRVVGSVQAPSGFAAPIAMSGSAQATMTPGGIADYTDQLSAVGQGTATYATVAGNARLTVSGGTFGGAALGGADGVNGSVGRGAFILTGAGRLDLVNVVVNVDSSGVSMFGGATQLFMTGATLRSTVNTGAGAGIHAALGTPQITLVNSTVSGFDNAYSASSTGIVVGTFGQPGVAATMAVDNAMVSGNNVGIDVRSGSSSAGSLSLTGTNLVVSGNALGGLICAEACSIDIAGGAVSGNGTTGAFANSRSFFGGIWLGATSRSYFLKLRNVQVVDNKSLSTGNTNQLANSGVTLAGNASSGFDLGSAASPGNNVFAGNTTGNQTTGLNVTVAAGITVRAVGNTFIAGAQGADGLGKYQLGSAPCGSLSCDLTSTASSGANFRITSGTLRLAE